jgi:hypothetical protein
VDPPSGHLTLPLGNGTVSLHTGIGISLNSRYPAPILFFVSREAKSEAKATYKPIDCAADEVQNFNVSRRMLRSFSKRRSSGYRVWLNPESDVIYLGRETCLGVLVALLKLGLPIQRIAFDAEHGKYGWHSCCDTAIANKTCLQQSLGPQVDSLLRRLRILHGFTIAGSTENVFPGCPSVKEVLLFMKTPGPFDPEITDEHAQGWHVNTSNPSDCVDFQRYTAERPYYPLVGQVHMSMNAYTDYLLATTISSIPVRNSAWEQGKKAPKFQLSRSSQLPTSFVFKLLVVNLTGTGQHRMVWWKFNLLGEMLLGGKRRGECNVNSMFPATYSGPGAYVLKFTGPEQRVAFQIEEIMKEVIKAQELYKQEIKIVEPKMAVFPAKLGMSL